jgi:DNA primase
MENVVAAMGCSISLEQQQLLWQRFSGVQIFFDGDAAGKQGGLELTQALARRMWVRVIACPEGLQPDKLSVEDIKRVLEVQFRR